MLVWVSRRLCGLASNFLQLKNHAAKVDKILTISSCSMIVLPTFYLTPWANQAENLTALYLNVDSFNCIYFTKIFVNILYLNCESCTHVQLL